MGNFKELNVWKKAKDLAVAIYQMTNENSLFSKDFKFKDQIRGAALSIASNIAEGDELKTNKQSIQYFYIAKGSTAELITQLMIAHEIKYIETTTFNSLLDQCEHISHMLQKLIQARSQPKNHKTKKP